jgi:hypothetical protein
MGGGLAPSSQLELGISQLELGISQLELGISQLELDEVDVVVALHACGADRIR